MTTLPGHWVHTTERHEWRLDGPMDAKAFTLGVNSAQDDMLAMGRFLGNDDAYHVVGQEDGSVLIYFDDDLGSHGYVEEK